MSKNLIVLITSSLSRKNKAIIKKLEKSINEDNIFLLISDNYFFLKKIKKYSNCIVYNKISDLNINKEVIEIVILSIFEISILEIINRIKIYKDQDDFVNDKFISLNFYSDRYPLKVLINPIQYLDKINTIDKKSLELFFGIRLKNDSLIKTYKYFNLTMNKDNQGIFFEINKLFFPKNINKNSLKYFKVSNLYKLSEYIFIYFYSFIPDIIKEKARIIFYNQQKNKINQTNIYQGIFSKSFRNKLILFKYLNFLKK